MRFNIYYCIWNKKFSSHELLKNAVEQYLGHEVEPFTVCRKEPHGKPFIVELPDLHFSISHAGDYWACAIGDAEAGLDLQDYRKRHFDDIAKRFFHPSEVEWMKGRDESEFFRIWAKKESYVKYTGEGLSKGLDYFSVTDGLPVWQQEVTFKEGYWMVVTAEKAAEISLHFLSTH